MVVDKLGVHRTHCCILHGCKYGDENCPVILGNVEQGYLCEECDADGLKHVDDIKAMLQLGITKCREARRKD